MSANAPVSVAWNGMTVYRPPHQNGACPSTVPKFHYIGPEAGTTEGAFKVANASLQFKLPKKIGTVFGTSLRMTINNGKVDSNGVPVKVNAPPTPHWISYIEIEIGREKVETLYPQDIYNETFGFLSLDQLGATQKMLNASGLDYSSGALLGGGLNTRYLPFNNCLTTARFYNAGIKEDITFTITFADALFEHSNLVYLSSCDLVIEEDTHGAADEKKWKDASQSTLVYNTVVRSRMTSGFDRVRGNTNQINLTSLEGNSAGLIVYSNDAARPNGTNAAALTTRYPIKALTLMDGSKGKKTELLQGDWLQSYSWTDNIQTPYAANVPTYLIPFSANFRGALEDGQNCGSVFIPSTDKIELDQAETTQYETVTVTNYIYAQLIVSGGSFKKLNQ